VDSGTTTTAFTLVRFELPPIPAGCELASAQLRLYASSHTADRKLRALRIVEPWSESDATWRNRPATTGTAAQTGSGSGSRRWNVISQVQSMYAGSNHGFLVRDSQTDDPAARQTFLSTERATTNVPKLVLVFE
jgi:hypothetical protein